MSRPYYFFVASLPSLQWGVTPLISLADFFAEAEKALVPSDFDQVRRSIAFDAQARPGDCSLLKEWLSFNNGLRNALTWVRATEANKDPGLYTRGEKNEDPYVTDLITRLIKNPDPLAAEKELDKFLWEKMEILQQQHYFDLEVLIAYAVRLRVLERYHMIASPEGAEIFEQFKQIPIALH